MPPITPPEKRPDRHYNFGRMNMWFAVSALALLATTLWMVVADYAQPWKRYQAEFRDLEQKQLLADMKAERDKINQTDLKQLEADKKAAEDALKKHQGEIDKLEAQIRELTSKRNQADADWRKAKANLDEARFIYDSAIQSGKADEGKRKRIDEEKQALLKAQAEREGFEKERAAVRAELAERRKAVTENQEKIAALQGGIDSLQTRVAGLNKDIDYFLLNAPLMDFVKPTLAVQQVILPGLTHNINFTEINRVDRCVTCHVAANRPGFDGEEWKEPFRTHPRLAEFVGDSSPHPYNQYGCTVCHGGLDRATEFSRAGHSPQSEEQRQEWIKKYNWKPQVYLEYPILPAGMTEAGCATCHSGGVWTPASETQDVGRELITHMGCNGCHPINYPSYTNLRKAGPDLTRIAGKTNPGWAYKWIESPRDFHPTTFMPHFFYQENTQTPENRKRQAAEIRSIVDYLWAKSDRPQYGPAPAGDPANGKKVFETVGCAGCHILDGNAKRDAFFPKINRLHGPNLVRTGSKVSRGWLYAWVKNPKQYFPDTNMPSLRLTDQEAADVVAYVSNSRDAKFENVALPAVDGKVRDELALSYLQNLFTIEASRAKLNAMSDTERNVFLGEQTITKYGCYGCHDIRGFENAKPIGTELTQEGSKPLHQFDFGHVHSVAHTRHDWVKTKVLRPRIWDEGKEKVKDYNELLKMPNFGMSEREAQAVTANIIGFTKETAAAARKAGASDGSRMASMAEGRKLITRFNCQGCHLIEGHGHAIQDVIKDAAMLPPNLAAQGARTQADWLFTYLHDPSRVRMRPWLTVRMPTFEFTDEEANSIVGYFAAREKQKPFVSRPVAAHPRDLAVGKVVFDILQCARCHPAGPVTGGGASTAELAPSLLLAGDRLRHDWVPSWIKNPQGWIPGTRMPNFFTESSPGSGEFLSPYGQMLDAPAYAAQKQALMPYFSSEAELKAYLSDADKVTAAIRDHIWRLAGATVQGPAATTASDEGVGNAPATSVSAGAAGGR
ncbi:MAG TPA: c-type cytochrome [Thermoanaerobaculia bacterium]|nr:c-type cytochrome [Thermoanaerobaculia bacterium]